MDTWDSGSRSDSLRQQPLWQLAKRPVKGYLLPWFWYVLQNDRKGFIEFSWMCCKPQHIQNYHRDNSPSDQSRLLSQDDDYWKGGLCSWNIYSTGPPAFREHMFLMLYANRSPDDRKKWSLEETFSVPVQTWALSWGWCYTSVTKLAALGISSGVIIMSHATDSAFLTFTWQNGSVWLKMVFPVAWISIQA